MDFKQLANQGLTNISRSSSCSHLIWNYFSPAKFYESVIFPIEDLIEDIKLDLESSYNGSASVTYNVRNFTNICGQSIYRDTEYYFNGRCFSLMMPQCLLDKGILEINVNFKEKGKQRPNSNIDLQQPGPCFSWHIHPSHGAILLSRQQSTGGYFSGVLQEDSGQSWGRENHFCNFRSCKILHLMLVSKLS